MDGQLSLFDNSTDDLRNEYNDLVKTLNYHCERYYNDDEPEISDFEYDKLNRRLKEIEKEHPDMISPSSPSLRVGWKAEKGVLVKHNVPMLSLQDVFSKEEVDEFINEILIPMNRCDTLIAGANDSLGNYLSDAMEKLKEVL